MPLSPGIRLGHYAVTALLGEGGMGQVWQATDTQLNREVALKILPDAFAADPDRLARFKREAQILASLNHPNIAAIYGIEESEPSTTEGTSSGQEVRALVLELVEGPTLADRIKQGPIPVDDALPIARQIAEALEAAHEAGVIHRDLKPANIKVREDGTVKVLDFGLAKALDPNPEGDSSESPTLTAAATKMGVIMGTATYMAPEQAKGKVADKRADIWAFGVVLLEMLTGHRVFSGETVSETLAAVMMKDPEWDRLPTDLPSKLVNLVRRCLEKDPRQRVRDIGDVRLAMEGAFETTVIAQIEPSVPPTLQLWRRPSSAALAVALLAGGILVGWSLSRSGSTSPPRPVRLAVSVPASDQLVYAGFQPVVLSPDGETVVYAATRGGVQQLYRRRLDQQTATPIAGTEGALFGFFSPDGAWIGFADTQMIRKVPASGGDPVTVTELTGRGAVSASWGINDTIVFVGGAFGATLSQVAAAGGTVQSDITALDADYGELLHRSPDILPDGRAVLFSTYPDSTVVLQSLDTGERKRLIEGDRPHYVPTGHLVFFRGSTLWAAPFDLDRGEITGTAAPVLEGAVGAVATATNGMLAYVSGSPPARRLVWVDREGREQPLGVERGGYRGLDLSPDDQGIALTITDTLGGSDVWVYDLARDTMTLAAGGPDLELYPLWTPDGESLVYASTQGEEGGRNLFRRAADGTGDVERLTTSSSQQSPWSWSLSGDMLVFQELRPETSWDIWGLSLDGSRTSEALIQTPSVDLGGCSLA